MNEAWRLVADGVLSVKDIDAVMSEGLGMRYAFLGAFEAAHLNAEGKLAYVQVQRIVNLCIMKINEQISFST